jgi:hypothetical protein
MPDAMSGGESELSGAVSEVSEDEVERFLGGLDADYIRRLLLSQASVEQRLRDLTAELTRQLEIFHLQLGSRG